MLVFRVLLTSLWNFHGSNAAISVLTASVRLAKVAMEGTEEAPQTPDGQRIVEILRRAGIAFQIFDVSGNAPAREELKQEFKWDRFPHPST